MALSRNRPLLILLLLGLAFLLVACRYTRIREFQRQLEAFDRYFTFAAGGETLEIDLRDPVLNHDDVVYFIAGPSRVRPAPGPSAEKWDYFFYQLGLDGEWRTPDKPRLEVTLTLEDARLTYVEASPTFRSLFPKELIEAYGRALGAAEVNLLSRSLSDGVGRTRGERITTLFPARKRLVGELGEPTRRESADGRAKLVYDYVLEVDKGENMNVRAVFVYDREGIREAKVLFDYMHFFLEENTVRVVQVKR